MQEPSHQQFSGADAVTAGSRSAPEGVVAELSGTMPWVQLVAIVGFVGTALMVLMGIVILAGGTAFAVASGFDEAGIPALGVGIYYLLLGALYFYPLLKLWKYARAVGRLRETSSSFDLETALSEQRQFWKFAGILSIVVVVITVVAVFGVIVFSVATSASA